MRCKNLKNISWNDNYIKPCLPFYHFKIILGFFYEKKPTWFTKTTSYRLVTLLMLIYLITINKQHWLLLSRTPPPLQLAHIRHHYRIQFQIGHFLIVSFFSYGTLFALACKEKVRHWRSPELHCLRLTDFVIFIF